MPLPQINLDDRTFDDLFNEARRRIPVYTPEWTDHNDSDPGITMLQLFAWLEEMIVWRLNQVPAKNYIKFLELVGLNLQPATPASAELTFTLSKGATSAVVPAGTQVSLASAGDGPPVIFETTGTLTAVGLTLASVQTFDSAVFTSYTDANSLQADPGFPALSAAPQTNAALYLGFDGAFPAGQHRLSFYYSPAGTPATVTGGGDPLAAAAPPVSAIWEYWAGDTPQWQPLTVDQDTTFALTRTGAVTFEAPADAQSRKLGLLTKPSDKAYWWLRYRIQDLLGAGYENPPQLQGIMLNTITAVNAVTAREELLGASNGRPNQTFHLANIPVLSLQAGVIGIIAVDEGDGNGYVTWTEVQDFDSSGPSDMVYVLDHPTGVVSFGDGEKGKIPRWLSGNGSNSDSADIANVKATQYQWGGGAAGNAGASQITSLLAAIPFVQSVTNVRPSLGGQDEEDIATAQDRAPMLLRTANRAVTGDDFAFIAKETPGAQIARAQAFPLLNPNFRMKRPVGGGAPQAEVPIPGAVTIVVVPQSDLPMPMPTAGTLQLVANWLDRHRLLTAELFVTAPRYRQVSIQVAVIANPTADAGIVETVLNAKLLAFFHPLTGGADGTGWAFGGTIYFSETYRQILDTDGVARIVTGSLRTYLDSALMPECQDVVLEPDELAYSLGHTVTVTYS
jgi:predicted phage baseplate assembly protein